MTSLQGASLLVSPERIGTGAFQRAVRDGSLVPIAPGHASPSDLAWNVDVRCVALAPVVPRGAALTGVAALWVRGSIPADRAASQLVTVAVRRGAHPTAPACAPAGWTAITDGRGVEEADRRAGIALCQPAAAVATALAWEPLADALVAGWHAIRGGHAHPADVDAALRRAGTIAARARGRAAWNALQEALEAA